MRRQGTSPSLALLWLAGLLEAEGSFLAPPPSAPNAPMIACRTTDRDIAERVATAFGVAVVSNPKRVHRTEYATTVKGARAVRLMAELFPLLGLRRQGAVEAAVAAYRPPVRKLSVEAASEIKRRRAGGLSVSVLARQFGVTRQTIHAVLAGRIHRETPTTPWREGLARILPAPGRCQFAGPEELSWLAGWLEGEGSFLAPPPSDPKRVRVSAVARDLDVVGRVARILGVSALPHRDRRAAARGWTPLHRVLCRGSRAVELMGAIEEMMGARRRAQIRHALDAVSYSAFAATLPEQPKGAK